MSRNILIAFCLGWMLSPLFVLALPWLLAQRPGLPTLLSVWTLTSMYIAGSNPRRGWTLALLGQIPWAWYTYDAQAYGFVWLNVGLTVVYIRNLWLQRRD